MTQVRYVCVCQFYQQECTHAWSFSAHCGVICLIMANANRRCATFLVSLMAYILPAHRTKQSNFRNRCFWQKETYCIPVRVLYIGAHIIIWGGPYLLNRHELKGVNQSNYISPPQWTMQDRAHTTYTTVELTYTPPYTHYGVVQLTLPVKMY